MVILKYETFNYQESVFSDVWSKVLIFFLYFIYLFYWIVVGRVFATGPWDPHSIPGHVKPKTLKMVLHASLLNTQQYRVRIKGKVEQSRERSSALPYTSV